MKEEILRYLPNNHEWSDRIEYFATIDSTNTRLKELAKQGAPHGTLLIADQQTGGRGRLGRSFLSPAGVGIYMSVLLRPDCQPNDLMHLTCAAAVAMCDAVESAVGLRPQIKWTNDLVYNHRKLAGILTELGLTPDGRVDYAIIGIGLNCCQQLEDFPEELRTFAGSLSMATGKDVIRAKVAAAMVDALSKMDGILLTAQNDIIAKYRRDCITVGREISLVRGTETRHGKAIDIDRDGALIVRFSTGEIEAVTSGEISIRGMYGYV